MNHPQTPNLLWRLVTAAKDTAISTSPIVRRELVGLLRTKKAFRITLATVAAASLLPLLSWPDEGNPMAFMTAQSAFSVYSGVFYVALFLFVPAVTAGAITAERERGTYEMLYNTRIRPAGIVLGKLFAHTTFFLLLFIFTFPMVAVLYLLGGFAFGQFLLQAGSIVAYTVLLGLIGLWCSMRNSRTTHAVILAYGMIALLYIVGFQIIGLVMMFTLQFLAFRSGGSGVGFITAVTFGRLGIEAAIGLVLFFSLLRRARFPDVTQTRKPKRSAVQRAAKRRSISRTWLTRKLLSPTENGIPDRWNPVFVASVRGEVFGAAKARRLLFWGVGGTCVLLVAVATSIVLISTARISPRISRNDVTEFIQVMVAICSHLVLYTVAIVLPGAAASVVCGEVEQNRLDLLRGTLLKARQIYWGKLLGVVFGVGGLLVLGVAICLPLFAIPQLTGGPWGNLYPLPYLTAFVLCFSAVGFFVTSSGFFAATLTRKTMSALLIAYVTSGMYLLVIPTILETSFNFGAHVSPLFSFTLFFTEQMNRPSWKADEIFLFVTSNVVTLIVASGLYFLSIQRFKVKWLRDR